MVKIKKYPLVCIVIVNWVGERIIERCINSLKKTSYKNFKVIVIENGSPDKSLEIIKKLKGFDLIELKENIGYAPGVNVGWNYCLKKYSPDYILNMNNDIETVQKEWLSLMVKELEKEKSRGICTNKTVSKKGLLEAQHFDTKNENILQEDKGQYDFVKEIETAGGAIFLVKRKLIDAIGGLDENLPFGADDRDYCLRAKEKGFKTIFTGFSKSIHLGSHSYKISEKDDLFKRQSYSQLVYSFRYDSFFGKMKTFLIQLFRTFITKEDSLKKFSFSNLYIHKRFFYRIIVFIKSFLSAVNNYKKIKQDYFKNGYKK